MADEGRDQSEFNMAVSYLNRINGLFYVAESAAITLDTYTWFHALLAIYRELSTEMHEDELELWEQKSDLIHAKLSNYIRRKDMGFENVPPELYKGLHKFELFLRKILKESGLQNKMMNDPRLAK